MTNLSNQNLEEKQRWRWKYHISCDFVKKITSTVEEIEGEVVVGGDKHMIIGMIIIIATQMNLMNAD